MGIALSLEFVDSPTALDLDWASWSQDKVLLKFNEGAKLSLGVGNVELSFFQNDFCMLAGDRDISDTDLTFMSPANFDGSVFLSGDKVKASLLFVLLSVAEAFEQDVWLVRLADGHHFHVSLRKTHNLWEGKLANFALKLSEII